MCISGCVCHKSWTQGILSARCLKSGAKLPSFSIYGGGLAPRLEGETLLGAVSALWKRLLENSCSLLCIYC